MLAYRVRQPYRVLRCVSDLNVDVSVLGSELSNGLRYSRFCKGFRIAKHTFDGSSSPEMVEEVNNYIREFGIDLVFPSCPQSARSFAGIKDQLEARSFPGPSLGEFDILNNKWEFSKLCKDLDILHPETALYCSKDEIISDIESGKLDLPRIVKPIDLAGQIGVVKLSKGKVKDQLKSLSYSPLLLQRFIEGDEIGASMYCKDGEVSTFIAHRQAHGVYSTFEAPNVKAAIEKVARKFKLEGVYNFDMISDPKGDVYFLECNPRFYYKILLSKVAGLNFAAPGIVADPSTLPKTAGVTTTRMPRAWPGLLFRPWSVTPTDLRMIQMFFSDPIKNVREIARIDWD
jgi:hypothetical protein